MKKHIIASVLMLLLMVLACTKQEKSESSVQLQNVQTGESKTIVVSEINIDSVITLGIGGNYFAPMFNHNDSKIFICGNDRTGLFVYDIASNKLDTLTLAKIYGNNLKLADNRVYLITNEYDELNKQRFYKLLSISIEDHATVVMFDSKVKLTSLELSNGMISFFRDGILKVLSSDGNEIPFTSLKNFSRTNSSGNKIVFQQNQKMNSFILSDSNYVINHYPKNQNTWFVEIAGEGLYEFSPIDSGKTFLGEYFNTTSNNKFNLIAFVEETNDGLKVKESRLGIRHISKNIQVYLDEPMAENPSWSNDGKILIYNTFDGKIKIAYLSYN